MATQASVRSKLDDITGGVAASEVESNKTNYSTSFADGTGVPDFVNDLRGVLRSIDGHNKTLPCVESDEEEDVAQCWIDEIPYRFEPPPSYQDIYIEEDECPFSDEELDQPMLALSHGALYWACHRSNCIRDAARARPIPAPIPLSNFGNPKSPIRPSEHALGRWSRLSQSWTVDTEDDALDSHNCKGESSASTVSPWWSDDEDEELEDPVALLDYFASCRKGGDASSEKEATYYQSESEDEDSLDSIEENEELGDVDDLLKYFESCKRT